MEEVLRKFLLRFAFLFAVAAACLRSGLVWGGQAPSPWQAEWERTLAAARKEGRLMVYGASDYEKVFGEFQKKYPEIKVTFVGAGEKPPALAQRLIAERRANQYLADLYVAGAWTAHSALYKPKALDPIKPVLILPEVVDQTKWWEGRHHYVDADGQYIFAFNGEMFLTTLYNPALVKPGEFRSYWDLLDPRWKGKLVGFDPTQGPAGPAITFLYHNPDLGPKFLTRLLTEMDLVYTRDDRQIVDWVATGKFAISLFASASRSDADIAKRQGVPIDWFGPKTFQEGIPVSSGSGNVTLINRAPHPDAAKVAVNWLLSREGQAHYQRIFKGPNSRRIDIPKDDVPESNRRVEGVKFHSVERPEWIDLTPIRKLVNEAQKLKP